VSPKRSSFFSRLADYFTAEPDKEQESEESI